MASRCDRGALERDRATLLAFIAGGMSAGTKEGYPEIFQ
jgi:hypothetical protein